ncbi:MAG: hypothetical protein U0359_18240 [Byssovorax sp.]
MRATILLALAVSTFALEGCTPDTPYRYTAVTPTPRAIPWEGRGNHAGTLHLEGSAIGGDGMPTVVPKVPEVHDTALHVAKLSLQGAALVEPVQGVQVGVRASYTSYDWTRETAFGTMPMPNAPSLVGFGPEVRIWLPFDRRERFALGIAGNILYYDVPFAEWTRQDCATSPTCAESPTTTSGTATYVLSHLSSEPHFVWNLGLYPSVGLGDHARYGDIVAMLAVTEGFQNDGFAETKSVDGRLSTYVVPIVGAGYGFRYQWARIAAGLQWPVSSAESPVQYGPSGWLTLGVDASLWNGKRRLYTPRE